MAALEPGARELERRALPAQVFLVACAGYSAFGLGQTLLGVTLDPLFELLSLVQVGAAGLFAWWFTQAVRCAQALGVPVGAAPVTAAASWFVPGLNLLLPFVYARRLAGPDSGALLLGWWLSWGAGLASGVFVVACQFVFQWADRRAVWDPSQQASDERLLERLEPLFLTAFIANALLVISAAMLARLAVGAVTRRLAPRRAVSSVWEA